MTIFFSRPRESSRVSKRGGIPIIERRLGIFPAALCLSCDLGRAKYFHPPRKFRRVYREPIGISVLNLCACKSRSVFKLIVLNDLISCYPAYIEKKIFMSTWSYFFISIIWSIQFEKKSLYPETSEDGKPQVKFCPTLRIRISVSYEFHKLVCPFASAMFRWRFLLMMNEM